MRCKYRSIIQSRRELLIDVQGVHSSNRSKYGVLTFYWSCAGQIPAIAAVERIFMISSSWCRYFSIVSITHIIGQNCNFCQKYENWLFATKCSRIFQLLSALKVIQIRLCRCQLKRNGSSTSFHRIKQYFIQHTLRNHLLLGYHTLAWLHPLSISTVSISPSSLEHIIRDIILTSHFLLSFLLAAKN